jgi:hypothetical protein
MGAQVMLSNPKAKAAAAAVLLALVLLPAPLLPPTGVAGAIQSLLGVGAKAAYLAAAVGLHVAIYGSLGVLAAFAVGPGQTRRQRVLRLLVLPLILVAVAVIVRSLKLGHVPMIHNAILPIAACALGVVTGLLFRQHGWKVTLAAIASLGVAFMWACWPSSSGALTRATTYQLQRLTDNASSFPSGEARFGALMEFAFKPMPSEAGKVSATEQNRAAILALGIAAGHERLARYAGLNRESELVKKSAGLRAGTTIRGRGDFVQHFCVSAALAVVENSFLSDAGGLIKEELDALTMGSGFSFADLAADRAGARFGEMATDSEASALAIQARLKDGYKVDDFFPAVTNLVENLTVEQFRRDYGGVGSARYREVLADIDARLDRCAGLSSEVPGKKVNASAQIP